MALLNQLRSDGHEVTAPFNEAVALRSALRRSLGSLELISTTAIGAMLRRVDD
jgi:hypothetical protein